MNLQQTIFTPKDIAAMDQEQLKMLFVTLQRDYSAFARIIMGHIVKEIPPYQREIYSALDKQHKHLGIASFRGSAKSTISHTIQGTSDICFAREPFLVFVSESIDQSSADLISVQDEIANNELIHLLFGNLKGEIWNRESTEFSNGVYITCKGYSSRIRGIKWKNMRPTKIIMDDVESEQNIATSDQRTQFDEWINKRVLPSGAVGGNCKYQMFGTIIHPQSWLARAKDMSIYRPPNGMFLNVPIEKNGVPAWGSMYSMDWINRERDSYRQRNQLAAFNQEYYNIPSMTGKCKFNVGMITPIDGVFRRHQTITYIESEGKKIPINVYIGVDPADSDNEKADNCIYFVIGVLPNHKDLSSYKADSAIPNVVLLHSEVSKDSPTKQVEQIFRLVETYCPKHVEIETQGYQTALADFCRRDMKAKGITFAIREFKSNKSKNNKWLYGLEPNINGGHISRLKNMAGWDQLEKELIAFNEDYHDHDDSIDGLFLALDNAYAPQMYDINAAIQRMKDLDKNKNKKQVLNWMTL